jgi:hypothetical protein
MVLLSQAIAISLYPANAIAKDSRLPDAIAPIGMQGLIHYTPLTSGQHD